MRLFLGSWNLLAMRKRELLISFQNKITPRRDSDFTATTTTKRTKIMEKIVFLKFKSRSYSLAVTVKVNDKPRTELRR